jgi:hypothetical protein
VLLTIALVDGLLKDDDLVDLVDQWADELEVCGSFLIGSWRISNSCLL